MSVQKYKNSRNWAVIDETGELIAVCVYKKGALEVARRLCAGRLEVAGMSIYEEHNFVSREDYLFCLALETGAPLQMVHTIANTLGSNEDFDALPLYLEDCMEVI